MARKNRGKKFKSKSAAVSKNTSPTTTDRSEPNQEESTNASPASKSRAPNNGASNTSPQATNNRPAPNPGSNIMSPPATNRPAPIRRRNPLIAGHVSVVVFNGTARDNVRFLFYLPPDKDHIFWTPNALVTIEPESGWIKIAERVISEIGLMATAQKPVVVHVSKKTPPRHFFGSQAVSHVVVSVRITDHEATHVNLGKTLKWVSLAEVIQIWKKAPKRATARLSPPVTAAQRELIQVVKDIAAELSKPKSATPSHKKASGPPRRPKTLNQNVTPVSEVDNKPAAVLPEVSSPIHKPDAVLPEVSSPIHKPDAVLPKVSSPAPAAPTPTEEPPKANENVAKPEPYKVSDVGSPRWVYEWLVRWCPLPEEKALMEELKAREAASSKKPMDTLVRSTPSSMTRDGKRP